MGVEQNKDWYNDIFSITKKYHSNWEKCDNWTVIWKETIDLVNSLNVKSVLDIGSGMGQFGQACADNKIEYKGIDFSDYAINYAKNNKLGNEVFEVQDVYKYAFNDDVDGYVLNEFLEHIEDDLLILSKLKKNLPIVFSVPNTDGIQHTRFFKTEKEVYDRYSIVVENLKVKKITTNHFIGWGTTK